MSDPVKHPAHYTGHPSGIECIEVTEHMGFCLGNAVKYLWRAGQKDPERTIEDLEKAVWYVRREIARLEREASRQTQEHVDERLLAAASLVFPSQGRGHSV
jgi:hypothetical protein